MKRSEAVKLLISAIFVHSNGDVELTVNEASDVLTEIEHRIGMLPPGYMKPIPFESDGKQYPLIPGVFKYNGVWCTPGVNEWEPEE